MPSQPILLLLQHFSEFSWNCEARSQQNQRKHSGSIHQNTWIHPVFRGTELVVMAGEQDDPVEADLMPTAALCAPGQSSAFRGLSSSHLERSRGNVWAGKDSVQAALEDIATPSTLPCCCGGRNIHPSSLGVLDLCRRDCCASLHQHRFHCQAQEKYLGWNLHLSPNVSAQISTPWVGFVLITCALL